LVNLAAADGHPAEIMDLSFGLQVLALKYLWENRGKLDAKVLTLPPELDQEVARLKLIGLGLEIDSLSEGQRVYLSSWKMD
jgi:adenosylhomocysteinase